MIDVSLESQQSIKKDYNQPGDIRKIIRKKAGWIVLPGIDAWGGHHIYVFIT